LVPLEGGRERGAEEVRSGRGSKESRDRQKRGRVLPRRRGREGGREGGKEGGGREGEREDGREGGREGEREDEKEGEEK
jgi:hypothetical protein